MIFISLLNGGFNRSNHVSEWLGKSLAWFCSVGKVYHWSTLFYSLSLRNNDTIGINIILGWSDTLHFWWLLDNRFLCTLGQVYQSFCRLCMHQLLLRARLHGDIETCVSSVLCDHLWSLFGGWFLVEHMLEVIDAWVLVCVLKLFDGSISMVLFFKERWEVN